MTYKIIEYFTFKTNIELPQSIFEQVRLLGQSRIDGLNIFQLSETDSNTNFFNYMLKTKDKKHMRLLKLNKLLNIQNKNEFNKQETELFDFFNKFNDKITQIEIY